MAIDFNPYQTDLTQYRKPMAPVGVEQAKYNRPTTHGPFGSSTVDANGNVTSGFSGGFGTLNDNLTTQAANVAATPMNWGQFGTLGTGADAGKETAQAAYSQSLSRLNPFWEKSENKLRTNLFQSGMGDSDAGDSTMGEFGRSRNDAYASAMTGALQAGMGAQQNAFQGNLASRQQAVANALRGQTQPFEELNGMQGFMTQPQVGKDNSMMVAEAAENQMAPTRAVTDSENRLTGEMESRGWFQDKFGEKPGTGERRRKWFESLPAERRLELSVGFGNWGEMP